MSFQISNWKQSKGAAPLNWLQSCPVFYLHSTRAHIKHIESHRFCSQGKRGCKAPLQYQVHMFFRNIKQITSWKAYQAVIQIGIAKRTKLVTVYSVVLKIKTHQTGIIVHCKNPRSCSLYMTTKVSLEVFFQISEEKKKPERIQQD